MYFDILKENNDCIDFNHGVLEVSIYDETTGYDHYTSFNKEQTKNMYIAMKKYYDKEVK